MNGARSLALAAALVLAGAAPAAARDAVVRSFDGMPIQLSFHPAAGLQPGRRAPTILQTHGWVGSRDTNPDSPSTAATGNVGTGPLRNAGFNVLTWDSRGFGQSGGTVEVDSEDFEGRDVQALLDWLATQPEARLDAAGDPRVGMHGVSYAGGIELVAAAIDKRIDAIAPTIAWHSLLTSLYKKDTVKGGWSALLYAGGQSGRLDPHITSAFAAGATTGELSGEERAWFESRGPGDDSRVIAWLRRYVAGAKVATGPGFEWLADDARWRSSRRWPPPRGTPIVATGSGTLVVNPTDAASGTPIAAGVATNAINVPIPQRTAQVVGEPTLRLTYSGAGAIGHVFAQIVDEKRNLVLGNQVTPLPVTLDAASHTVTRSLEGVAASMAPGGRYHLQVIGGSQVYGPVRGAAAITVSGARLELPTVRTTSNAGAGRLLPSARRCKSRRRFTIRVRRSGHARLRSATVWIAGKRVKVRRRHGRMRVVADLRRTSRRKVTVRIVARTTNGRVLRDRRVYRLCG